MTADDIIDGILDREGQGKPPYVTPGDAGGRTSWGISERQHPTEWLAGPPSRERARAIYFHQYVVPFDVLLDYDLDDRLRVAMIDDAVLSGVQTAIKRLQWTLGVPMDGIIGPLTAEAILSHSGPQVLQRYVVERAIRLARLVQQQPTNLPFLAGWITRALRFLPEPEAA